MDLTTLATTIGTILGGIIVGILSVFFKNKIFSTPQADGIAIANNSNGVITEVCAEKHKSLDSDIQDLKEMVKEMKNTDKEISVSLSDIRVQLVRIEAHLDQYSWEKISARGSK